MQSNWCKLVSFCFLAHKRWMWEDFKCTASKLICASVFVLCILKIAFLHYSYWLFLCACVFFHFFVHIYICMCLVATTYVCVSAITHQVHPGGGLTQGHADPGGCVSDDLMIHPLQSAFIFFGVPEGPDANPLTGLIPLGAAAMYSHVTMTKIEQPVNWATSMFTVQLFSPEIYALKFPYYRTT